MNDTKESIPRDESIPHYETDDPALNNANKTILQDENDTQLRQRDPHLATVRPGMYAGQQDGRTQEQWLIDALRAYGESNSETTDAQVFTSYELDDEQRVSKITIRDRDQSVTATLTDDSSKYSYESELRDDDDAVKAEKTFGLANVILSAYVNLGVLPAQNFDHIECENKH